MLSPDRSPTSHMYVPGIPMHAVYQEEDVYGNYFGSPRYLYQVKGAFDAGQVFYDFVPGFDEHPPNGRHSHEPETGQSNLSSPQRESSQSRPPSSSILSPDGPIQEKIYESDSEYFDPRVDAYFERRIVAQQQQSHEPVKLEEMTADPMSNQVVDQMIRQMERRLKIEKYKMKKRNRLSKIKYENRQKIAENRVRIKGKFISKKETDRLIAIYGSGIVKPGSRVNELDTDLLPYEEVLKHTQNTRRIHKGILNAIRKVKKLKSSHNKISADIMHKLRANAPLFVVYH